MEPSHLRLRWDAIDPRGKWPAGNYIIRVRASADRAGNSGIRRFIEFGVNPRREVQGASAFTKSPVPWTSRKPSGNPVLLRRRRCAERADRTSIYSGERNARSLPGDSSSALRRDQTNGYWFLGRPYALWVDWLEIERLPDA